MEPALQWGGKRDFGSLRSEAIAYARLAELEGAEDEATRARALAGAILELFDDYHARARAIPDLAKRAFERRDWPTAIALSQERIAIYSLSIERAVPILRLAIRAESGTGSFWQTLEAAYTAAVADRYEADLALAYLASFRRWVFRDSWEPVPYDLHAFGDRDAPGLILDLVADGQITPELVDRILDAPGLEASWRDRPGDARAVAVRIAEELALGPDAPLERVEIVCAGFFRNRGAYIVGRLTVAGSLRPLALALLHDARGVHVDAVILRETTLRHVFSSTLANFHVPVRSYHALVDFLFTLMPQRPRGQHYSTVGYNHVGKMAVMESLTRPIRAASDPFDHAPGPRGSVAIGFTAPTSDFVAKVIRDRPTSSYKWDRWDGVESVLSKYRQVHELNRAGSMLDNILYQNVSFDRALFAEALLEDLLEEAAGTVTLYRDEVFFRHLIVQSKMIPVPLYLSDCTPDEAEIVVIRLGQCIRNNAAANVFNRDLDGRNYGVSALRFVYLFDYDAIEPVTEINVHTNADREAGEEDVPAWFFETGPVFLPEELEMHLRLPTRPLRRLFREAHGEILTAAWWERMQGWLREGRVPKVRTYPRSAQLDRGHIEANLTLRAPG
ncbi:MAG: isocitrate dehydrogenase kinase/phosphatase AceK regulatory subunit [Paracoccaceae bacterium]